MTCKLCLQDKNLVKKSHIIPDFMYKKLYDKNHKIIQFSPGEYIKGVDDSKFRYTGEFEGNLLCVDCESKILGLYESYASKAIFGGQLRADICPVCKNYKETDGFTFTHCKNVDYTMYKLFLLSILWRSSICSREMFNQIDLGPHEENLRKLILSGNAGSVEEYPIMQLTYIADNSMPKDLIAQPQKRKSKDGYVIYIFIIGGMIYNFYVNSTSHKLPDYIQNHSILPSGEFTVYHLPKGQAWTTINKFFGIF